MTQNELYSQLVSLRTSLKKQFSTNGRAPSICTDEALMELASHPPRQKEELKYIEGLGDTFVEKYGDYFMPLFIEFYNNSAYSKKMPEKTRETLKILENRLVNISKKNRLLYMSRLQSKTAMDLYDKDAEYNKKVLSLIMGSCSQITLCQMGIRDNWQGDEKRFKKALQLIREVSKEQRESGQYDLYIGYPYVIGKTFGEDFPIRAPLVLFPVTFEKHPDRIILKRNKEKDILFNNNLVLTQNKFLGKANEIPQAIMEEFNKQTFIMDTINYYKEHEINIQGNLSQLEKFEEMPLSEFPDFKDGEYHISNNAILGRFSIYNSALQKDYRSLISSNTISNLVDELLCDFDNREENNSEPQQAQLGEFSEQDITYINDLNSSQENVIRSIDTTTKLVVQGPPGTGKSQTITSLIADAVTKGKNVLMVSQKKAALDVIYSRLGNLSNFAILLSDMKDKNSFYKQLYNMFACDKESKYNHSQFQNISGDIDSDIGKCYFIGEKLKNQKLNNSSVLELYADNEFNYWVDAQNPQEIDIYFESTPKELLKLDYSTIKNIREKFLDDQLLKLTMTNLELTQLYPWLKDIKTDLKQYDRNAMVRDCENFANNQEEYLKKSFWAKLFGKGKRKKELNQIFSNYFDSSRHKKDIFNNPQKLTEGIENIDEYSSTIHAVANFNNDEKKFAKALFDIHTATEQSPISISDKLSDFIIFCLLSDFESENKGLMNNIEDFNKMVDSVCQNISDKKDLSKARLKNTFSENFYGELLTSKRYLEICRQIQSQRKWSIEKFMNKFSFELLRGIKVWIMTPETVSETLPLENGLFDLLIFDEASQIYIEKGIPSIERAKKVVIAGDHKQLRPSSLGFGRINVDDESIEEDEEFAPALEEESLLDLARFKYPSVLLNYHYRAKYEELINFSNYAFYDGLLNVSPNVDTPEKPPIEVIKIDGALWENRCNKKEALKVVSVIKKFLTERKNKETIGIITFNVNQRDAILDELDRECLRDQEFASLYKTELERKDNGEDIGLFVKNIENVQGDERDHIIFSIGYAKNIDGKVVRNFGWLNQQGGENRLNVAISRAKRKITIVSSIFPEELDVDDLKNEGPKLFKKYLEYATAISNKDTLTAVAILNSLTSTQQDSEIIKESDTLAIQIKKALEEKGVYVETNVGLGNYKLDLAIKNSNQSKYILGIELDSKLYATNYSTRERDIFRKNYFECRGWNIYRLWSCNWWRHREQEIENILNILKSIEKTQI
ncbi:MAG: HRDC domain-containing protein [Clostridia bacterium]|nr:HRDC domain-containing protein [Clostridia bacterium]